MKIKVDEKNGVVIAKGRVDGLTVSTGIGDIVCEPVYTQAVAVCKSPDVFNAEYGERLASKKFKFKEVNARMGMHISAVKAMRSAIDKLEHAIESENMIISQMAGKCVEIGYQVDEVIAENEVNK